MHHVCGEHEWDGATCSHGPLTEVEGVLSHELQGCKRVAEDRVGP